MLAIGLPTPSHSPVALETIPGAELQARATKLLPLPHRSEEDPLGCVNSFALWGPSEGSVLLGQVCMAQLLLWSVEQT